MQKHQLKAAALLIGVLFVPTLAPSTFAQTCACAGAGIRSEVAPPPLPVYDQPPIPSPGYLWTPGYWAWNNYDYYWVPGTWIEPPHPGLLWTPGYWGSVDGAYAFNPGYWGPHVGFYGGVSYGFGYGGVGYEGGYWNNGAFFYNRTVNHIGGGVTVNVYEKAVVVNNESAGRASFNGRGGTLAKPTAEEQAAAAEPHAPPTAGQVAHVRAASMKSDLFVSANHGKPAIAATATAAAFSGPGVVRAKAAGETKVQYPAGETPPGAAGKEERKAPEKNGLRPAAEPAPGSEPKAEIKTPEKAERPAPANPTPDAESKSEKKAPAASGHETSPGKPEAVEKDRERKPAPAGSEKRLAPAAEQRKAPATGVAEQKHAPGQAKPGERPPAHPAAKEKEECGKPGQPKCP
ncbi:MAG: hypothetical protein ABSG83_12040 [Roseiarcus sp.]